MVSMMPKTPPDPAAKLPAEEPLGEQYFPQQMSWYAAEGPQGRLEDFGRWIRENPWVAVGLAASAGLIAAVVAGPALRLATGRRRNRC